MRFSQISALLKRYRHLLTIQNAGLAIAVVIALSWVWGAVVTLQKNYKYQRQIDDNTQQIALTKLQNQTYQYQQAFYKSNEFLELSARAKLDKALPGEHLVVLPSSDAIKDVTAAQKTIVVDNESNFAKWISFFFTTR